MFATPDIILILVVVLLLFGPNKLPELARSLGKASKEFKNAQNDLSKELTKMDKPIEHSKELKTLDNPSEDSDTKIFKLASEIGIDTKNKTVEQLTDEIRIKIRSKAEK